MALYKVVWEIEIDADTPLAAAKEAQKWLQDKQSDWQFYVQEDGTHELFSVDLQEEDEDAVLPVDEYEPMIKALRAIKNKK